MLTTGNFSELFGPIKRDYMNTLSDYYNRLKEWESKFKAKEPEGGFTSRAIFSYPEDQIRGKHYHTMVIDDLIDASAYTDEQRRRAKLSDYAFMYGMSPLYKNMFNKKPEQPMGYLDPTNLSKKELIALVMNLQGLIEGLLCEETDQQLQIKSLTNQLECSQKNEQFAKRNGQTESNTLREVIRILAHELKESND